MQIDPIGKKANFIVSLASTLDASPQEVINRVRAIENPIDEKSLETSIGDIFVKNLKDCTDSLLNQKIGKLILSLLNSEDFENRISDWLDNITTSLKLWVPNQEVEKRFQDLYDLPLCTWEQYESLISRFQGFTSRFTNPENQTEERELECKFVDYPKNAKPYLDAIFTREVGLQVTTFALKEGSQQMVFPSTPKETKYYNVTCSKLRSEKKWDFIRIVFNTRVKDQIRKIHQRMLEKGRADSLNDVLNDIKHGEHSDSIYDVVSGFC